MDRAAWDERYAGKDLVWSAMPNRFLVDAVTGLEPGRALDLACGEGRNAVWLATLGWRVTGVDFSEVALGKARALAEHHEVTVEWVAADLTEWRPDPETFDLVAVVYLQPPPHLRALAWSIAAEAVAPGGRLVVIGHDSRNLTEGYGGPPHPDYLYTAGEVVAAVGAGFDVDRAETVLRPVETDEGVRHAIDNLVVVVRAA
jgi:SAM-dependent methyltransferase